MRVLEGSLLRVNLYQGRVRFEDYAPHRDWLGGQGLNQSILFRELSPGVEPYHPDNILTVAAGALTGSGAPGASRTNIDTLNPYTGGIGSGNAGGDFATALRRAGLHNIILKGRAENLSLLKIDDGRVTIEDAARLKGLTVSQTGRALADELGPDYKTLIIGPAGENLVRSACIILDGARSASRCGIGAVMGSKNLKAIAVRGSSGIKAARPEAFRKAVADLTAKMAAHPMIQGMKSRGVYANETFLYGLESPYRNFSGAPIAGEKRQRITPDHFLKYKTGSKACGDCPVGCWKVFSIDGPDGLKVSEALQINAIHNFAARLDLFDPQTVLQAHALCNDLGLDQDNTTGAIAWAFDCFDEGLITTADTNGLELRWGDREAVFRLIHDIAFRRGFGDLLAEGCKRAAEHFPGTEELCVHVKGQELFESIWISPAWALGTVVAARGGTHTRGAVLSNRLEKMDPELCLRLFGVDSVGEVTSIENKERLVVFYELLQAVTNSLGVCYFTHGMFLPELLLPEDYARLYESAVGEPMTGERLMWLGERIFNLEKCFNVLHTTWSRADDRPPARFTDRPLDGRYRLDAEEWETLLTRYYRRHGWDEATGRPLARTLDRLALGPVRERLVEADRISPS